MQRWRWVMATAIVVGLGALVAVLLQNGPVPATTTVTATTTITSSLTTATSAVTTSTTTAEQRVAEVETILQELWFGWFDAIYRQDADALWQVVATAKKHQDGVAAMGADGLFVGPPTMDGVLILRLELLLDEEGCLVVYSEEDFSAFRGSVGLGQGVSVLWPDPRYGWRFATSWRNAEDRWEADCDELIRETTP